MGKNFVMPADGQRFEADWPTKVDVPVDGGKLESREIATRFAQISPEDKERFFKEAVAEVAELTAEAESAVRKMGPVMAILLAPDTALAFLEEVIVDIKKLKQLDASGKAEDVSYSVSALKALCSLEYIKMGLIRSYFSFHTGVVEKN